MKRTSRLSLGCVFVLLRYCLYNGSQTWNEEFSKGPDVHESLNSKFDLVNYCVSQNEVIKILMPY